MKTAQIRNSFFLLAILLLCLPSCKDEPQGSQEEEIVDNAPTELNLPTELYGYSTIKLPLHYSQNSSIIGDDNTPSDNLITDEGATLGRVLFYDVRLSKNYTISCSSCHLQENAFTDPEALSVGFEGERTPRNSMSLANARFYENGRFFWDERAATLEEQTLMPIQDHIEMGMELADLELRLSEQAYYEDLFTAAFGDSQITSERISKALSQFIRSMVSVKSKWDDGLELLNGPLDHTSQFSNMTPDENAGAAIFLDRGKCITCHQTEALTGVAATNNGLDMVYADNGLGDVLNDPTKNGVFKVPSLKNIAVTGPYMHDGRFQTLEEVVDHYSTGVAAHPNLDFRLKEFNTDSPRRLNLTPTEKNQLIAFLHTLTDEEFLTDENFSNPFVE